MELKENCEHAVEKIFQSIRYYKAKRNMPITNHLPPLNLYSKKKKKKYYQWNMAYWKEGQKGIHNTGRSQVQETNKDILFQGWEGKKEQKLFEKEEAKILQDIQGARDRHVAREMTG